MKKLKIIVFLAAALMLLILPICALASDTAYYTPVDVGNFNDYSSGGSWGGGSSWSSGSSSGLSFGSGALLGSLFGRSGGSIVPVIVIGVLVVLFIISKAKKGGGNGPVQQRGFSPAVQNHTERITNVIKERDPLFEAGAFVSWTKEVFMTLQAAWTARSWEKIRPFEKEELFNLHKQQLDEYIALDKVNVIERVCVNTAYLNKYVRESEYEYLTVFMDTRMRDYIKNIKTDAVLQGDPNADCYMKYLLTFMRKNGVMTEPGRSGQSIVACPYCGAPTKITSAGKCEFCDHIVTTGEYDWVLCDITAVKPGVPVDNSGVIIR